MRTKQEIFIQDWYSEQFLERYDLAKGRQIFERYLADTVSKIDEGRIPYYSSIFDDIEVIYDRLRQVVSVQLASERTEQQRSFQRVFAAAFLLVSEEA